MEKVHIRPGETRVVGDGVVVRARPARFLVPIDQTLTITTHHEASHAVGQVDRQKHLDHVTDIPEGDSLGHMAGEFDPVAAAMPVALGLPGVGDEHTPGSDIYQIVHGGHSLGASVAAAKEICDRRKPHIAAVATGIKNDRYLSSPRVHHIVSAIDKGASFEVVIEGPGIQTTRVQKSGIHNPDLAVPISLPRTPAP